MDSWDLILWIDYLVWFMAGAFFGLQGWSRWKWPPKKLRGNSEDLANWRSFVIRFSVVQAILFILCGIFQLLGGYDSFRYVFFEEEKLAPFVLMPRLVIIGALLSFLGWVLFADGAESLIKYRYTIILRRPWMVKTFYILFIPSLFIVLVWAFLL